MVARLEVHSPALVAVAGQLDTAAGMLSTAGASVPVHPPLAADEVSTSAAARLSAHGTVLASRAGDGAAVLAAAAVALRQAIGAYQQTDTANAGLVSLHGSGATTAPVFTPAVTTNAATPALPISPPAPRDGKSLAALIEAGSPSAGSVFTTNCHTYAARFREAAHTVRAAEASVRAGLSGQAGPKIADALSRFATWAEEMAEHAEALSAAGQGHHERFSRTQQATPTTSQFSDVERQLQQAQVLNSRPATAGMYTPVISQLQTQLLGLHSRTHVAATNYHIGELPQAPPGPPPVTPIVDPAPGSAPTGTQPGPGDANPDDHSADPRNHAPAPGDIPGGNDDADPAAALDDPASGLDQMPLGGAAQPMTAMASMIPGLLGGVVGAAAAIPAALAQQGQSVLSQAAEAVSGLANGLTKPDPDTDLGGTDIGNLGGSTGSGASGGGGGATQPAAGPGSLAPSAGTGMMSVAGPPGGPPLAGGLPSTPGAAMPDAGPGGAGAPMMMPPMGAMGAGAGGSAARPAKPADKEVLDPPVPNGEPIRGEVLRRTAKASIAETPRHSGGQDDVVVTSARTGKRVVIDDKDGPSDG
ncbi:PE domain-containing protein [Mycobacterium attenuatum]|uniref:PE domain-containing protein n=1 Tax=Mycobacterium attenuatum TaxID=2341086 RepID=UPI000F024397|nr:PE domain-containing protein [Mycobacterium attenuatum]VBA62425.1 hypothetical protein LAUMK41_05816 [Mycobacterium attenuatum]